MMQAIEADAGVSGDPELAARRVRRIDRVFIFAAVAPLAIAALVLAGWLFGIDPLKSIRPEWPTMKANTVVGFLLAGASVLLLRGARPPRGNVAAARACAIAVVALAIATLSQDLVGWDLGIDQLLFEERGASPATFSPNRMAPATALAFALIGTAVLLHATPGRGRRGLSQGLAVAAVVIGYLSFLGYLYGVSHVYWLPRTTALAFHTALAIVLLSVAILCLRPFSGPARLLLSDGPGGHAARRLFPAAVLIPTLLGLLRLAGQAAGLYDTPFGVTLVVTGSILLFAGASGWNAAALDRLDALRREALRAFNDELEDRVRRRTAELAAANAELEAFSYSVAHDLRAPLRWVDGCAHLLAADCVRRQDETGLGHVRKIRQSVRHMSKLIDALLTLARVARLPLQRADADLSRMARDIAAHLDAVDAGRSVAWEIADGLHADGDPMLLQLALGNLLGNAWKFTRARPAARIQLGAFDRDGERIHFVRDNGVGFDMAYAGKLFRTFERLHRADEFEGTGIGLALVKRVIQRHGGRVWAEGQPGEGATVFFTLGPIRPRPANPPAPTAPTLRSQTRARRAARPRTRRPAAPG
ncbi:MAG: hypothetical protein HYV18_07295 [Gammaproteobacteria bacterium]|nr:hypothetical protein [Gammaproteobacteria bacterium]